MHYNVQFQLYKVTQESDDVVGGAQATGTPTETFWGWAQETIPSELYLQQGIEVERTIHIKCDLSVPVVESDELEVIYPTDHFLYAERLLVGPVQTSALSPRDYRAKKRLVCRRRDFSRSTY